MNEIQDPSPKTKLNTAEYQPQVVIKFKDYVEIPYVDEVEEYLLKHQIIEWQKLKDTYPEIVIKKKYRSLPPERIIELVERAQRLDSNYRPFNFLTVFLIDCQSFVDAHRIVEMLKAETHIEYAYVNPRAVPTGINESYQNPYSAMGELYLHPAPVGIDAEHAWTVPGGDGKGQTGVLVDKGYMWDHEDLEGQNIQLKYGIIPADIAKNQHGTGAIGIVCAQDNKLGGIGIVPNLDSMFVYSLTSEFIDNDVADCVLAATWDLKDTRSVLLLEVGKPLKSEGTSADLPTEVVPDNFAAIQTAVANQIVVIEPAGNGSVDLDNFSNDYYGNVGNKGKFLNPDDPDYKFSGAIMVGAGSAFTDKHERLNFSNYGRRIDCYAHGELIITCRAYDPAKNNSLADKYTLEDTATDRHPYNGTSGASAIIASAALATQGMAQKNRGARLSPALLRAIFKDPYYGTPSNNPANDLIGPMPDLFKIAKFLTKPAVKLLTDTVEITVYAPGTVNFNAAVFEINALDEQIVLKLKVEPVFPFGTPFGKEITVDPLFTETHNLWFSLTMTEQSFIPTQVITVEQVGTNNIFQISLVAKVIDVPYLASVLMLDQSGSMADLAGNTGLAKIDLLKQAVATLAVLVPPDNRLGAVAFSNKAQPLHNIVRVPVQVLDPPNLPDPDLPVWLDFGAALSNFDYIPNGSTAIGQGLQTAAQMLDGIELPSYFEKTVLVFTDGKENVFPFINKIIDSGNYNYKTYAVALGGADQVNAAKLDQLTKSVGGYCLVTGELTSGTTEDYFRLTKYFIEVLYSMTGKDIVKDPQGTISPGQTIRIPWNVCEADYQSEIVLLTDQAVVSLDIEAPNGEIISENNPGVVFGKGPNVRFCRINLPLAQASQEKIHAGIWHAVLKIDQDLDKKDKFSPFIKIKPPRPKSSDDGRALYSLSTQASSNLNFKVLLTQSGYSPGEKLYIRANLTEYGQPVENRAKVGVSLRHPDKTISHIELQEIAPGIFDTSVVLTLIGTYEARLLAHGKTFYGTEFTREKVLTATISTIISSDLVGENPMENEDDGNSEKGLNRCCHLFSRIFWIYLLVSILIVILLIIIIWITVSK